MQHKDEFRVPLLIRNKGTEGKIQKVCENIDLILDDDAEVNGKVPEKSIEIKDLEKVTTKEELTGVNLKLADIESLENAYGGTQTPTIRVSFDTTRKIAVKGNILVIFVVWGPLNCFKCWQFGHIASSC